MALPGSDQAIGISSLKAHFGSSANNLNAYYKGGGIVPNDAWYPAVPTSGVISLRQFHQTRGSSSLGTSVEGSCYHSKSCVAYTGYTTITGAGGSGTYTYSWSRISGSATPAISSTTSNYVRWSGTVGSSAYSAVWRCSISSTGYNPGYIDVTVTLFNSYW